jgi:hypothetical protein
MGRTPRLDVSSGTTDEAEEILFLTYRLDVLHRWPESERRNTLIAATIDRLRALGVDPASPRPLR